MNLPIFPRFKKLTFQDKDIINKFAFKFPPYSDYYFMSLFSWNVDENVEYSFLNNSLVVKLQEYEGESYFYSFLGNRQVDSTINELLLFSKSNGMQQVLKLIPEHNLLGQDIDGLRTKYVIKEDPDNFDYLLSIDKLFTMKGKRLHQKRKLLNHYLKKYLDLTKYEVVDLNNNKLQEEILSLVLLWKDISKKNIDINVNELQALKRIFKGIDYSNLKILCIYISNQLKGFTIFEQINSHYVVSSFQKADLEIDGIVPFMYYRLANYLKTNNCLYINIEQDLGIPRLRRAKSDYDPIFLKKYIISPK